MTYSTAVDLSVQRSLEYCGGRVPGCRLGGVDRYPCQNSVDHDLLAETALQFPPVL